MGRSGYTEDCENLNLWRGAVERAIKGKRGQAFLRELREALDAMAEKKLIANKLVDSSGDVCALGAIYKTRGLEIEEAENEFPDNQQIAEHLGLAYAMVAEIEYLNDEFLSRRDETPEERWVRMREWVEANIVDETHKQA